MIHEKPNRSKLEEYQEKYTFHSKEAFKYKRWIQDIVEAERKDKTVKSVPLFVKDLESVISYVKKINRPVENKEIIEWLNTEYKPTFKRWKNKLDSATFYTLIGQYLIKDNRVINWQEKSKYTLKQTRYYQIK